MEMLLNIDSCVDPKDEDDSLYLASDFLNLEAVKICLAGGTSVNAITKDGSCALHIAVRKEQFSFTKLLLEQGAQTNLQDKNGNTPLHYAVTAGVFAIVEEVLKYNTDVNITNQDGETSLHMAIQNCRLEERNLAQVVKLLLECGASVDSQDKSGRTPLCIAAERCSLETVQEILKFLPDLNNRSNKSSIRNVVLNWMHSDLLNTLLDYGLVINPSDANDIALLHKAIEKGYVSIVNDLLMYGASVNSVHSQDFTPLHVAVKCNQEKIVNLLINYGAHVNVKCAAGKTPLFYAFEHNNCNIINILLSKGATVADPDILINAIKQDNHEGVAALLQHGADVNGKDINNRIPLHFCSFTGLNLHLNSSTPNPRVKGEIAELLLSNGAKVDERADLIAGGHETPLHAACQAGYEQVVGALLRHNAKVNTKALQNTKFMTPLLFAARTGNVNIVTMLLNRGANITCKNYPWKETSLHLACKHGHIELAKLLLTSGATVNARTDEGATPLHKASEHGFDEIVEVLLQFGARVNLRTFLGRTALHLTAMSGSDKVVAMLCKAGADLNARDDNNNTAVHFATAGNNVKALDLLIKVGTDINAKNSDEFTPLHIAVNKCNVAAIDCLLSNGADVNLTSFNETPVEYAIARLLPNYWSSMRDISKTFTRHIVKVRAKGLKVSKQNLRAIATKSEVIKKLYDQCEKEMACIKSRRIGKTGITFYNVMTGRTNSIANYMRNTSVVQEFRSEKYKVQFPEYASELEEMFRKGWERRTLLDKCKKMFIPERLIFGNIPFENFVLPENCVDIFLNYLENADLNSLLSVLPR